MKRGWKKVGHSVHCLSVELTLSGQGRNSLIDPFTPMHLLIHGCVIRYAVHCQCRERRLTSKHGGGGIRDRNDCSSSQAALPRSPPSSTHSVSQTQLTRYKVGGGLETALISKTYRAARSSTDATHLVPLPRTAAVHIRSGFFLVFFLVFLFPRFPCSCYLCIFFVFFLHPPS